MSFVFPVIGAATKRLIMLVAGSALLLAAGQVPPANNDAEARQTISDDILAPMTIAEVTAANAALAATTPADIAAAARANIVAASSPADLAVADTSDLDRPAKLVTLIASMSADEVSQDSDMRCLATAVYFESRGEPLEGQLAVAQAIINRLESGSYPTTACGVINQPRQFSYDRTRSPRAGSDWKTAQAIAKIAMQDLWHDVAPRAMSFHATYVSPNWRGKTRVAQIGRHVFYR